MKKISLLSMCLLCCVGLSFGQTLNVYEAAGNYYRVYSTVSQAKAEDTAKKMDAFFNLFNSYFHFDPASLESKLNVRIFADQTQFNNYLSTIISEKKENFVYLQYSDAKKSELLGFLQDEETFNTSLLRHGYIQFLKSFITNPPLWLQRGFAVYFEKCSYDKEYNQAVYKENLGWLETLKSLIKKTANRNYIPMSTLLKPDTDTSENEKELFYAESWGLVTFLLNSGNKNYNRILWDSISALKKNASTRENEMAVIKNAFSWIDENGFTADAAGYFAALKTFPMLVEEGIDLYAKGDLTGADERFTQAIILNGNHYLPYYYLGLIHYARKDYALAEYYYQSSLLLGGDQALCNYALGVNAFADNKLSDAQEYLQKAKEMNPASYREKAEKLLARIELIKADSPGK
ncbi:MAG: hypothetical protein AB1798_17080 [Spirochaetota bacterium]